MTLSCPKCGRDYHAEGPFDLCPCGLTSKTLPSPSVMRQFASGATRNVDADKLDYEGFLSPLALERFAQYMHKHRQQADGQLRASDNWQKGIPREAYMKSAWRHFIEWWKFHRNPPTTDAERAELEEALCALLFNAMGYLHEVRKKIVVLEPDTAS